MMRNQSQTALIVIGSIAITPAIAQDVVRGQKIAERHCARCHSINTGENSRHRLAPPFPIIANRYSVWGLQEALAEGIVVGHADMPPFTFSPDQINNLLSFMDTFTRAKDKPR